MLCHVKTRLSDSARWNNFKFRDGDIVVASWAKSGTTLVQQIVTQLYNNCDPNAKTDHEKSLWVEETRTHSEYDMLRIFEEQESPRMMKSHLPANAIPLDSRAKYIYVVRDGRDACFSAFNHINNVNPELSHNIEDFWSAWLQVGYPFWPYFSHVKSWWNVKDKPNILLLHFNDLSGLNKASEIEKIARFIGVFDYNVENILRHTSIEWMRENCKPPIDEAKNFFFKGTNGRWKNSLTSEQINAYIRKATFELGNECAEWMMGEK